MEVDGVRLQCCDSLKFLGVILDSRVTWLQHVKYVAVFGAQFSYELHLPDHPLEVVLRVY